MTAEVVAESNMENVVSATGGFDKIPVTVNCFLFWSSWLQQRNQTICPKDSLRLSKSSETTTEIVETTCNAPNSLLPRNNAPL